MKTIPQILKSGLLAVSMLGTAALCHAGAIQLTPVRINLSSGAKVAVLTVRNTGAEESVMQVSLNKWTVNGATYVYTPSQDLVVTPLTFRLAPGKQQIVRIGLRGAAATDREQAYRLLVEEVPPPASPDMTQTRLVVRHDVPVFVAAAKAVKPVLDVTVDCMAGRAMLHLGNIGKMHLQMKSIELQTSRNGPTLAKWEAFDYLLPDVQKIWELASVAPEAVGKNFVLIAQTDQGLLTTDVVNPCH